MTPAMSERQGEIERNTKETQLRVRVDLDGSGDFTGAVGVPFLEHMLDLLARHGGMDIAIEGKGDLEIDAHHTVEDLGICLGQAVAQALNEKRGIERFGYAAIPMEETLTRCALDICGRPFLHYACEIEKEMLGKNFDVELAEDFFRAVAMNAGLTVHLELLYGKNSHHIVESLFKSFARAMRQALARRAGDDSVPSTKGAL